MLALQPRETNKKFTRKVPRTKFLRDSLALSFKDLFR